METLIGLAAVLTMAFVPMVVYALVLWWFDRYEKEPLGLILASFLWGAVPAVIFSIIAQVLLDVPLYLFVQPSLGADLVSASIIAPLTEEPFKALALLLLLLFFRREIDSPLDGILYGALVGFGFATTENTLYFLEAFGWGGIGGVLRLALYRAFIFGLNHALFTGCSGLGIALARTSPRWPVKIAAPIVGLGAGMVFHGLHNAGATLAGPSRWPLLISILSDWTGVVLLLAIIVWTSLRERIWIVRYLRDEVAEGRLPASDHLLIQSYWRRVLERTKALLRGDLARWWRLGRYYRLATELAFAKHRLDAFPGEPDTVRQIDRLRRQLAELRDQMG